MNRIVRATHGDSAIAICIYNYSVGIGDKFHENQFFTISENGEEKIVNESSEHEEIIAEMQAQIEFLKFKAGADNE